MCNMKLLLGAALFSLLAIVNMSAFVVAAGG